MTACWGIVPAAGMGRRMNEVQPKQYLNIAGKSIVEHSIAPLLNTPSITKIIVVLNQHDVHWQKLPIKNNAQVETCVGGASRAHSVRNALMQLPAAAEDWVLVHDAVRPCLQNDDLEHFITSTWDDTVGAILAIPINDSIKRVQCGGDGSFSVVETLTRDHLWLRAVTPQMFRYRLLCAALDNALADGIEIDDEALAMHRAGHEVKVRASDYRNIKVTRPDDLEKVRYYLNELRQ